MSDARKRFDERHGDFARAVGRLAEATARPVDDVVRDSVIQRFEFSVELLWQALRAWLAGQGVEAAAPRQILRHARANGAVESDADADLLQAMVSKIGTSPATPTARRSPSPSTAGSSGITCPC